MAAIHSHQDVSASLGKVEGKILAYDNDNQAAALGTVAYESTEEEDKARIASSSDIERATEAEETRRFLLTSEGKKAERRFLVKLDIILLTWAWFAYCIKIIDDSNYRTAYVSGMREALNMNGNELNYLETVFRVGYSICLIPSQIVLMKLPASWWLPPLELTWGILTALMAFTKSVNGMYALRFFIGCLEASSYPGIIAILCLWYTPTELVTRLSIFSTSYPGAMIFTSFMQAALHKNMNGKAGLAGWQWLFIINALMTVVIAAAGFIFLPDKPGHSRVYWLTADEDRIARSRVDRVKRLAPTPMSWVAFKRIFYNPVMWFFTFAYSFWSWSQNANVWFALFLKSVKNADGTARFSVPQINTIPIGGYVLMIIAQLFFAWLSDRTGWRASLVVVQQVLLVIGAITLSVWPSSFGVKMWAYFMCWLSNAGGPTLIAWMADYTPSPEDRAIVVGIGITLVFSMNAAFHVLTVLVYPAKEAPNYRVGYKAASAFGIACILVTAAWKYYSRNTFSAWEEEKRLDREEDEETRTANK